MLNHLHIQNFTIIQHLDLELHADLTVLTGETGAGKSIILDALELTLGGRADSSVIRQNSERCEISSSFDISAIPTAQRWLKEHDIDQEDEALILRRVIGKDSRSRAYIQNQPVPLQSLKELSALLVNVHGQHEHQALLKKDTQRHLLDAYAGQLVLAQQVTALYTKWHQTKELLSQLLSAAVNRAARTELLQYQVAELDTLALAANEISHLEEEHKQLTHAEQLIKDGQQALSFIEQSELHRAQKLLLSLHALDSRANMISLENALIEMQETTHSLQHYLDNLELNPERLAFVEERLQTIHTLARKHQVPPEALPQLHQQLLAELKQFEKTNVQELEKELQQHLENYQKAAAQLSQARKKAAKKISTAITEYMQKLGMPGGRFEIQLEKTTEEPTAYGLEQISFLVSTNPGQALQALSKVVSGGELSRISLAIQLIRAQGDDTPTLIFDEVDVGIGGGTAEIVGNLLRQLAETAQVLCVTHLPQVAAKGHHHLHVNKKIIDDSTLTQIKLLSTDEKIQEIARMLGGLTITQQTLAHAKEMLETTL